jgi:HAD superfamily hydrolase (TIGR01509 family)
MIGRRTDESARLVLSRYPLPFSIAELMAHKSRLWERRWRQGVPAMPGLFELQEAIRRRGIPWAVATSSPRYYAEHILQQLGLWPTNGVIVGGDEVAHGKPAPDLYLLAAERLGIPAESCLALEDSVPGAQAALAAGMQLIVVPAGTAPPGTFDFAPYVLPSLHEVAGRLDFFFGPG